MRFIMPLVSSLLLAACSGIPAQTPQAKVGQFPNWPTQFDNFRFHWYAAPGIDLTTGPAVAIRAYVESYNLAVISADDHTPLYPGFLEATPSNLPQANGTPIELTSVRPDTRALPASLDDAAPGNTPQEYFGYQPSYLLKLERVADTYQAIVCEGNYATFRRDETRPGKYRSVITDSQTGALQFGEWQSVSVRRIELADHHPGGADTLAAQYGPMPAPAVNVFGRWFITSASRSLWGPSGQGIRVATPELQQQCNGHMPDDAAVRKAMYTGFHDEPPPHGDPIPGWPKEKTP